MTITVNYILIDGEERNREAPETFRIPTLDERKKLRVGDWAKCMFHDPSLSPPNLERMWVKVTELKDDGSYVGVLDNDPVLMKIDCGDRIEFEPKHVINIELF